MNDSNIDAYLSGERLYGDDLTGDDLFQWFKDEENSYFEMSQSGSAAREYGYHALNYIHGYRWLPRVTFKHLLGIGGAAGDEFMPILDRVGEITVLEPAEGFVRDSIGGIPARYVKPDISGDMPFQDNSFDLITCFGALHHIPNVSKVVSELARITEPTGYVLVREPIISMGDWRNTRAGLTRHERGIPIKLFRDIVRKAGFRIVRETKCMFPVMLKMGRIMKSPIYSSRVLTRIDQALSFMTQRNEIYHRQRLWQKFAPASVFLVLQRIPMKENDG